MDLQLNNYNTIPGASNFDNIELIFRYKAMNV